MGAARNQRHPLCQTIFLFTPFFTLESKTFVKPFQLQELIQNNFHLYDVKLPFRRHKLLSLRASSNSKHISLDFEKRQEEFEKNNNDIDIYNTSAIEHQLGYTPPNFVRISSFRKKSGSSQSYEPIAIQTYPLKKTHKRHDKLPFPTLYWLTNPEIHRAVSDLERRGYVKKLERRLLSNNDFIKRYIKSHRSYAHRRWISLTNDDRNELLSLRKNDLGGASSSTSKLHVVRNSGIAGIEFSTLLHEIEHSSHSSEDDFGMTPSKELPKIGSKSTINTGGIKCLHSHYAHYRSSPEDDNIVGYWIHQLLEEDYPEMSL